jgi:transcriptional regulator
MEDTRRKAPGDLLQGTLDMLVLKALSRGPRHGYAVAEFIHQTSEDVLKVEEGALYPALHRLELRGLVTAEWGLSDNNRRAKFYQLTITGRTHLAAESETWARLTAAVSRILQTA